MGSTTLMTCKTGQLNGARLPDWAERLDKFIQDNLDTPFTWGAFDCGRLCIKLEIAMYGVSRFDDILTEEKLTIRKAYKPIKDNKCKSLWEFVDSRIPRLESPAFAQRGDFFGYYVDGEESLAICLGDKMACISPTGLVFIESSRAAVAWRV